MTKRLLLLNTWRELKGSLARFFSIAILLGLGVFVIVGLKSTGPDMRETAISEYQKENLADAQITSPVGFTGADQKAIRQRSSVKTVRFGQMTDVQLKGRAVRVLSTPKTLSTVTVVSGHLPKKQNEIALGTQLEKTYRVGQTITLDGKTKNSKPARLAQRRFKVTGFVKSSEFTRKENLGTTSLSTGQLTTFAVVPKGSFTSQTPNLARVNFKPVTGQAYSKTYEDGVNHQITEIQPFLNHRAKLRRNQLLSDVNQQVKQGQTQLTLLTQQLTLAGQQPAKNQQIKQLQKGLKSATSQRQSIRAITYPIKSRNDYNAGYSAMGANAQRVDVLSDSFPIFFFAVAILVCFTTMQHMVAEKRTEMGTFRALGYSKSESVFSFLTYGILSAVLGTVVGAYLGSTFLPRAIYRAYTADFNYGSLQLQTHWGVIGVAGLLALGCILAAIWSSAYPALKEQAAQLMLPKPPKGGSRILLERWTWFWRRLSFSHKVTARNLFRYKGRMLMTLSGVAACVALLITAFGIRDSLNNIVTVQYRDIVHYDLIGVYNPDSSAKDQYLKTAQKSSQVKRSTGLYTETVTAKNSTLLDNQSISLLVPQNEQQFSQQLSLRSATTHRQLTIPQNGVIVTQKLAKLFNLKQGDTFTFKSATGHAYHVKVAGIAEMYMGHDLVMGPHEYRRIFDQKFVPNAQMIQLKNRRSATINQMARRLTRQSASETVVESNDAKQMIETVLTGLNQVVLILIVASSVLAFVVLFTLTYVNVSERIRELATLKVLGFYPNEVDLYIFRETIILTLVGILIGYGLGDWLHAYIMTVLPPEMAMAQLSLHPANFMVSTVITLLFLVLVMVVMAKQIRRIDMLGALKSVD
ncbi:ABC transporter permease [Levilactobacillus bambusae]|uniref:ABC transporter permease n=1 Tax=Levilactobacillus bambusae TaxID=2024736 RepID=A0A2V1MZZ4_9LACO|nr:ABC transporter permease [Levilactobacillus bambusae]PWG00591.1 ABC transporter permease [Levilactobacillus bambusae]